MGAFVKTISNLFTPILLKNLFTGGGGDDAAKDAAQQQAARGAVARDNQLAALQAEETKTPRARAPRGRRLLMASETGERGLARL